MEELNDYQQELRWRSEAAEFATSLWNHSVSFTMGAVCAVAGLVSNLLGNSTWMQGMWWSLAGLGLLRSFFCAWRDEHRSARAAADELAKMKERTSRTEAVTVTRLTSSSQPKAKTFFSAADSARFAEHFVIDGGAPAIRSSMFKEWMNAPKQGPYRQAHCNVEDFFFVCTQGNQFRGLLTANWYPHACFAWIGYLFTDGGDWARGRYAPELVKHLFTALNARSANLCFFDVEESQAEAMLRLYARYISTPGGPCLYTLDAPYRRPPDCAGAAPGAEGRLGIVDLGGALAGVRHVSAETCHRWLEFVYKDAHGDAEAPDTEKWAAHHNEIDAALAALLQRIPEGSVVALREV